MKMVTKQCANPDCTNTFSVNKGNSQKCCSEYCHMVIGDCRKKVHTDMTRKLSRLANKARSEYYYWAGMEAGYAS